MFVDLQEGENSLGFKTGKKVDFYNTNVLKLIVHVLTYYIGNKNKINLNVGMTPVILYVASPTLSCFYLSFLVCCRLKQWLPPFFALWISLMSDSHSSVAPAY